MIVSESDDRTAPHLRLLLGDRLHYVNDRLAIGSFTFVDLVQKCDDACIVDLRLQFVFCHITLLLRAISQQYRVPSHDRRLLWPSRHPTSSSCNRGMPTRSHS